MIHFVQKCSHLSSKKKKVTSIILLIKSPHSVSASKKPIFRQVKIMGFSK